jgi:hypothetical protein
MKFSIYTNPGPLVPTRNSGPIFWAHINDTKVACHSI